MKSKKLKKEQFLEIISSTPLVSIDLVIRNSKNRILLGRRVNEPAKGKWFVPGGRINKEEDINDAFKRICKYEIGTEYSRNQARLIGVFTHLYDTNVFLADNVSTHYVVLAYELRLDKNIEINTKEQHSEYRWFAIEEVDPDLSNDADPNVHKYVLEYFRSPSNMDNNQYNILNTRRDSFNNLLWQTPVLSLTAQAFLFTIILSQGNSSLGRAIAAFLALIVSIMSLQLFSKHRFMEEQHAKILRAYEEINLLYAANRRIIASAWAVKLPSYCLWMFLLGIFGLAAISSLILVCFGLLK